MKDLQVLLKKQALKCRNSLLLRSDYVGATRIITNDNAVIFYQTELALAAWIILSSLSHTWA